MNKLRSLGILIFIVGILVLVVYAIYELFQASDVSLIIKYSLTAVFIGLIIILCSLISERLKEVKK